VLGIKSPFGGEKKKTKKEDQRGEAERGVAGLDSGPTWGLILHM